MGFFSARRAEDLHSSAQDDGSVVRVIRSRFYGGKAKGKEREGEGSSGSHAYTSSLSDPSTSFTAKAADKRSITGSIRALRTSTSTRNWPPDTSTISTRRSGNVGDMASSRTSTDIITVTLAQRLNELATANSEGLLSDDEYRLLRQSLFERFASGSAVPTETSLVAMSKPLSTAESRSDLASNAGRRLSSHFHVQPNSVRTPSISSKKSISSTVTGLLRRATSKRVVSNPADMNGSDSMSVYSMASSPPERVTLPRKLAKQNSDTSLRTDASSARMSQSFNRRTIIGNHTFAATDPGPLPTVSSPSSASRSRTRSGSRTAPPSSFHGSSKGIESTYTHINMSEIPDDDTVESVQDIKHQIELVEAEGLRLLDAFNGLELSTLTRRGRKPPVIPPLPSHGSLNDGSWPTGTLRPGKDVDTLSYKSSGSGRTAKSLKRSPSFGAKPRTSAPGSSTTLVSPSHSIMRKPSQSSVSSRGRNGFPALTGHLATASTSTVNLTRSTNHLPLETVEETDTKSARTAVSRNGSAKTPRTPISPTSRSEVGSTSSGNRRGPAHVDEEELMMMEAELADIRRRRAAVTARYESRIEYLRARLKGAELREKILRK
ncbi:uncharacterized protein BXZ73DRAFT_50426 [Epithele typhae]|uniref:uncharacterized protein n=1 Tax=Epithele typhae TaxID=378194 RepID=UPI00200871FF|nr:uncharacterized protein BXZ73DRAFT_50426 [Epithele typhae]KAH9924676.1 hypothetical protein BXZ73DRAFT_50426 [Epithele typhae]